MDIPNLRTILRDLNSFGDILVSRTNEMTRYVYHIEGRLGQYTIYVYLKWITLEHNGTKITALTDDAACDILMDMITHG